MKKLASLLGVLAVAATAGVAFADTPKPEPEAKSAELFHCVKVEDPDHAAPCGEKKIVEIVDPCWKPDPCNPCCKPPCVKVCICVPKATCCDPCNACCKDHGPKITRSKCGHYVKYDYGKYRIELTSKNGVVRVDYDN